MPAKPEMTIDTSKNYRVTLDTNKGEVVMDLMPSLAPKSVNNFVALARQGFYDGLTFHRYVEGFVIQGGDPTGTGSGGPGYKWEDEPVKGSYREGAVAMANAGPNTNGSQFFICNADCQHKLTPNYNLFGYVVTGLDVVKSLRQGDQMKKVSVEERDA
jgi:peptidyl-prolyl cis-trans isomerase B (cyclophilin B)